MDSNGLVWTIKASGPTLNEVTFYAYSPKKAIWIIDTLRCVYDKLVIQMELTTNPS